MNEPLDHAPEMLLLNDPFQMGDRSIAIEGQQPCALDSCHYTALVVQSIEEDLGPPVEERSPYEQRFLDTFFGIRHRHPRLLQAALHTVVYTDSLLIPNIDIYPGQLLHGPNRIVQYTAGGGYHLGSQENLTFLLKLTPLVLNHPIGRHLGLTPESYKDALERWLGLKDYPRLVKDKEVASRVVAVSVILQELRSVMLTARENGIPAITFALDQWPTSPSTAADEDSLAVLRLYFQEAVHTPKLRNIQEALELRQNPRIEQWRSVMREWTLQLSKGEITQEKIGEAVREANGYIQGAKFAKELVPTWTVFVTLPIGLIKLFFGIPALVTAVPLVLSGLKAYGTLVWASVSGQDSTKYGWYLLSEHG